MTNNMSSHDRYMLRGRIEASGLPKAFLDDDCTLDGLDVDGRSDALDAARRWLRRELRGLLLVGPFGVGKTTIAAAAAKQYLHDVGPLKWLPVHRITVALTLPFDNPMREDAISALGSAKALVLDDLDKTRPTEFAAEPLFSAIDRVVTERIPLIATTNLRLDELAAHWPNPFGEALASRLAGYCETWEIDGDDRRVPR